MNTALKLTFLLFICTSCEIITIGTKREPIIDINQNSPIGAIYLFKTELDSNNIHAATQILASPTGGLYLALERYEMYEEIARLRRLIGKRAITLIKLDTLTPTNYRINIELDYIRNFTFTTARINDYWYIINYEEMN
jgi:hypothetical protein